MPHSNNCSGLEIPEELLIDSIFPHLFLLNDSSSLKNVSLVCKSWFKCAMAVKWRTVMLDSHESFVRFYDLISREPEHVSLDYAHFLRHIIIQLPHAHENNLPERYHFIDQMVTIVSKRSPALTYLNVYYCLEFVLAFLKNELLQNRITSIELMGEYQPFNHENQCRINMPTLMKTLDQMHKIRDLQITEFPIHSSLLLSSNILRNGHILTRLHLRYVLFYGDELLHTIANHCPNLQYLHLEALEDPDYADMILGEDHDESQILLSISENNEGLHHLVTACKNIKVLWLYIRLDFANDDVLYLDYTPINNVISALQNLLYLERLGLRIVYNGIQDFNNAKYLLAFIAKYAWNQLMARCSRLKEAEFSSTDFDIRKYFRNML